MGKRETRINLSDYICGKNILIVSNEYVIQFLIGSLVSSTSKVEKRKYDSDKANEACGNYTRR